MGRSGKGASRPATAARLADRSPSAEELEEFQKTVRQDAWSFAGKAREFISRFPTNENIGDARITVVHSLTHAVAAGDGKAEEEIQSFTKSVLADQTIPEDERVGVLLYAGNAAFMKKAGMRMFTEGMQKLHDDLKAAVSRSQKRPSNSFPPTA